MLSKEGGAFLGPGVRVGDGGEGEGDREHRDGEKMVGEGVEGGEFNLRREVV